MVFNTKPFQEQKFDLDLPTPDAKTFLLGTVTFLEPDSHGGILQAETDNLGVTAKFTITDPLNGVENVTAVGKAFTGSVSDHAVDYTLTWSPLDVSFGNGGLFEISLNDLSFTTRNSEVETVTYCDRSDIKIMNMKMKIGTNRKNSTPRSRFCPWTLPHSVLGPSHTRARTRDAGAFGGRTDRNDGFASSPRQANLSLISCWGAG